MEAGHGRKGAPKSSEPRVRMTLRYCASQTGAAPVRPFLWYCASKFFHLPPKEKGVRTLLQPDFPGKHGRRLWHLCKAHLNVHLMFRILRQISFATAFFIDCISIYYFGVRGFMAVLSPFGQLLPKRAICDLMDDLQRHAKRCLKNRVYG